jgi:hypothetical protein
MSSQTSTYMTFPRAHIITDSTPSLPPIAVSPPLQPTTSVILNPIILRSRYLNSSLLLALNLTAFLPSSCSKAFSDQTSLPQAMEPVSSIKGPTSFGLGRRLEVFEHCLHGAVVVFEYSGTPQHSVHMSVPLMNREKMFISRMITLRKPVKVS